MPENTTRGHGASDPGEKARSGRRRRAPGQARSNRAVTFLTDGELERLERIAEDEDRSLSSVIHRIIVGYLKARQE